MSGEGRAARDVGRHDPDRRGGTTSAAPEAGAARPEAGGARPEAGGARSEAGGARSEAGAARPEAGGARPDAAAHGIVHVIPVWRRRLATVVHKIHGTRGLLAIAVLLVLLSLAEPFLPDDFPRLVYTVPLAVLLVIAIVTLPREAIAIQDRFIHAARQDDAVAVLARNAVIPAVVVVLLLPRLFLSAYGVPHFSPLTGLVLPDIQHTIAVSYLYALLLLGAWNLRRSRRLAPHIRSRPLQEMDAAHRRRRDLLWWLNIALITVWLTALQPFWSPFSLFQWPPGLASLEGGVRGIATVTYAGALPALLFVAAVSHMHGALWVWRQPDRRQRMATLALFALHVALYIGAALLHLYDLFWIARYQAQSLF